MENILEIKKNSCSARPLIVEVEKVESQVFCTIAGALVKAKERYGALLGATISFRQGGRLQATGFTDGLGNFQLNR